jgi:hypothetical protein
MICAVCYSVLRGHQGAQWRGTWDLHFDHHVDRQKLVESANMSCCICRSILREITNLEEKEKEKEKERERHAQEMNPDAFEQVGEQIARTSQETEVTTQETIKPDIEQNTLTQGALFTIFALLQVLMPSLRRLWEKSHAEQIQSAEQKIVRDDDSELEDKFGNPKNDSILEKPKSSVTAYLSQLNDKNYRLDFKWRDTENVGTFILQKTGKSSYPIALRSSLKWYIRRKRHKKVSHSVFSHNKIRRSSSTSEEMDRNV